MKCFCARSLARSANSLLQQRIVLLAPPNAQSYNKFLAASCLCVPKCCGSCLLAALLLGLERKVRVHPATS
jgi:hypothetical protein